MPKTLSYSSKLNKLIEFSSRKGNSTRSWGETMKWEIQTLPFKNLHYVPPHTVLPMLIQNSLDQSSYLGYLGTNLPIEPSGFTESSHLSMSFTEGWGGEGISQVHVGHLDFIQLCADRETTYQMLRPVYVPPNPTLTGDGISRWDLWAVIRSWGWTPHEWN